MKVNRRSKTTPIAEIKSCVLDPLDPGVDRRDAKRMLILMNTYLDTLKKASPTPESEEEFLRWTKLQDGEGLLLGDITTDEVVLFASMASVYMHAIITPRAQLEPPDVEDLLAWNFGTNEGWGICISGSDPPAIRLEAPMTDGLGAKSLEGSEKLIFWRRLEGVPGRESYCEISQKFTHILDLHWMRERQAYCQLDEHGDIEDVLRIIQLDKEKDGVGGTVVCCNREAVDHYLHLTQSVLVRTFDFSRFRLGSFNGWPTEMEEDKGKIGRQVFYQRNVTPGYAGYMRGIQLIEPRLSYADFRQSYSWGKEEDRDYASFIAHDWRNGQVAEISSAPSATTTYFAQKEGLAFELSPAFFRPEVLSKYKADSEKYQLNDRTISCRGAWYLKTYDINEAGQVHTYLRYLRNLPYTEQLHWKAYNEKPKGPISKRAIKTDFEGRWDLNPEPLTDLRSLLRRLVEDGVEWWKLPDERLLEQVQYPASASGDEWGDEILRLSQLLVEGIQKKWLRTKAMELGMPKEESGQIGSIKLAKECIQRLGIDGEEAKSIIEPLDKLQRFRSKATKAHRSGKVQEVRSSILSDHGSYREHFKALCRECYDAFESINAVFTGGSAASP